MSDCVLEFKGCAENADVRAGPKKSRKRLILAHQKRKSFADIDK
jgi:hypothetical protein